MNKKIIALTGAGISRGSGIPTFEESGDIRKYLTRKYFEKNPIDFYNRLSSFYSILKNANPNDAHKALSKYKIPIITMNADKLHQQAGSKNVIEIHGNIELLHCYNCNKHLPFDKAMEQGYRCIDCGNILKHDLILYSDQLSANHINSIYKLFIDIDYLIIIGTSFYTSTSKMIKQLAKDFGAKVIIINENAEIKLPKLLKDIVK